MLTARQLYFEAVKVGDELPPLVKPPVDRLQIARYVGAAGDFNPLYVDEPHAKNSGFPSVLGPGMIAMGFLAELAVDWVRGARLRKFSARFVKIVWPGDVLTARGKVVDRRFEDGGRYAVDIEVWAENQRGELVVRGLTTFQLYYSADDEARQRAGGAPLVVTPQEEEARLAKLSRAQPSKTAAAGGRTLAPPRVLAPAAPASRPSAPGSRTPAPAARPSAPGSRTPAPAARTPPPAARPPAPATPRGAPAPAPPRAAPAPAARPQVQAAPAPAAAQPSRGAAAARAAPARPKPSAPPSRAVPAARAIPAPARARARVAEKAKAKAGKAKAARPRPAKRAGGKEKAASARGRSRGPSRKPTGKKRR
jgi:acyl dehydratase